MFISRLHQQSERPQGPAGIRAGKTDDGAAGSVHRAQGLPGKGIKGLAVAKARLLRGVELDTRQIGKQSAQGQQVSFGV